MNDFNVNIICGPTASGKSDIALKMAIKTGGVIINADSQQVYKDLPILTACPLKKDYEIVPHKLYEFLNGDESLDVKKWIELAVLEIKTAWNLNKTPILVGGTGFYIKSLINGLSPLPDIKPDVRRDIRNQAQNLSTLELYNKLEQVDYELAKKINPNDKQRILRGLEVYFSTGKKLSLWQQEKKIKPLENAKYNIQILNTEKNILNERIEKRTDKMIQMGVIDEVANLIKKHYAPTAPIFKIIGVNHIINYLQNKITKEEMKDLIILETKQYAKRQRTFFKTQFNLK